MLKMEHSINYLKRNPISIFKQVRKAIDEKKKGKFERLVENLRKQLPSGFKIGAAVGAGDCFFDSVAQGLNELKSSQILNVKLLREDCANSAGEHRSEIIKDANKGSYLVPKENIAFPDLGSIKDKEGNDVPDKRRTFDRYLGNIRKTADEEEHPIWGRLEIEGKIICEKYGVKIKVIELRDKGIGVDEDKMYTTTGEVGEGNDTIYIVNYRNHFVPLLCNIKKDIKRSIKVSREEAYGIVVESNFSNISQSYISTPLQDIENSPHKQSGQSKSPGKENQKVSGKRECSVTDIGDRVSKRPCIIKNNEDLEFPIDLQNKTGQDKLDNACQTNRGIPHQLIGFMYQLDLSVLCSLRKFTYEHKYPSVSLAFEDSEIDMFSNIVLRYEKKSAHIQIENVDKYYIDNDISYARLFSKGKKSSSLNNYFNSFVEHRISKSDSLSNNVEYLVIFTNAGLGLTEEKELKKGQSRNFYPFKFDSMIIEECSILKDFLFTSDNAQGCSSFYQFSQNKTTREELLKRLEFSPAMQKVIRERKLFPKFEKEIKEAFLNKLVFAVNQPNREELNSIIKSEMEKNSEVKFDYITLLEGILSNLEEHKKRGSYISGIAYEFNLLILFLHKVFLHREMFSINFEGKSHDISNDIAINYKSRITYVKAYNVNINIGYSQLFPSGLKKEKSMFSIDKLFALFVEKLREDLGYFIIYTNADLDLTEENELKKRQSKGFYPLKFDSVCVQEEKYKILRYCSYINENGLYQFSLKKTTRKDLLKLLKLPSALLKEKGILSKKKEKEIKKKFFDSLIFAVSQPNKKCLNRIIRDEIEKNNDSNKVPYNYKELHEIALRWLESHEFGPMTKGIMENLLEDIKNKRSSYQIIQKNIDEEIKFARSVVGSEGTPAFYQFLGFLTKGEGKRYLKVLKRQGINLISISSILDRARTNSIKAFEDLYNLWFDAKENKTRYLKTLEAERVNLANVSSILSGAGVNAAKAFKGLYDLWFDTKENKTQYLKALEESGTNLAKMSSILSRAGANAAKAFKNLYDLWFDEQGNKTQCLKTLEENRINLANVSSILSGAGSNAAKAFKDLYDLWFDVKGNKTPYLKALETEGINLSNMSSILSGAGTNAAKAFKDLYDLWFDEQGKKTQYLKTLEENGISLSNISGILSKAGTNAAKAFEDLYDLWFNVKGNKTHYLKAIEKEGINLSNMSSILGGAGTNAAKAFKDLYDLWFDEQGKKTQCLKTLEENGINLFSVSSILSGAGTNTARAFKDLYGLWFDKQNSKTQCLITLEKNGISLSNISGILGKAGANAARAFKDLYDLWFDAKGRKTQYLKTLKQNGISLFNMSSILHGVGVNAAKAFKDLYDLWFDKHGNNTQYLKSLEENGINLSNVSSILGGAGSNAAKAFKNLYNLWFNKQGEKTHCLRTLEDNRIDLSNMSSILHGVGGNITKAFKDLYDLWFDKQGNKTQYLKTLEENGINLTSISSILNGVGSNAVKAFKGLYDLWFDAKDIKTHYLKTLEENRINLSNMSSILGGAGVNAAKAFKNFYDLWFDNLGNKTQYLKTLEENEINLSNISSILNGAGVNAAKAFKDLYYLWFDEEGNQVQYLKSLKENGINLTNMSSILNGVGSNAVKAFKDLYNTFLDEEGNKKRHLKHFIRKKNGNKSFTLHNLSSILSGVGANAKDAFEKLHSVCFNDKGKRTELLNNFYNADFEPSNLSSILCGAGVRASSILIRLHNVCFDNEGERTKLLDDFCNAGFRPGDLCSILSGAGDILEKFHGFCFIEETKKYLNHFVNEKKGFTLSNLSEILHGAKANIFSAFKDFHNVCFDETGSTSQLLDDFLKAGFTPSDLSNILTMAGNNAASILINFHKSCFNEENYLNHFLAEKKIFMPKSLSKILDRAGLSACHIFEKVHDLCFDMAGNRTKYLDNLIENNPKRKRKQIPDILYKKVRGAPFIPLGEQNTSDSELEDNDFTSAGSKPSSLSSRKRQKQSLDKSDSKKARKNNTY